MPKIIAHTLSGEHTYTFDEEATIGRHPRSLVCLHDPMVSKRHAVVRKVGDDWYFEDVGSSNGSFVDGVRVTRHKLKDGDRIRIGRVELEFVAETEVERIARRVTLSQELEVSQIQDRIAAASAARFLPEKEVTDLNEMRVDYEKLRLGIELLQNIGPERDLDTVLDKAASQLVRVFHADRCAILLQEDGVLKPRAMYSDAGEEDSVAVSESVLNEVRESKSALLLADTRQDERFSQASSLVLQGIRSVMCAPIMEGDELVGVVHMDTQQAQNAFTRKDLQLFTGIVRFIAMAVANSRLMRQIEEEARMKAQFERLLSPSVAEQVLSGKVSLEKGGEVRDVTILFADIRGFTSMSRRSSATSVVAMLNRYFETIVEVVFKFKGTVDKYIGDEIMVLFGAPVAVDRPADRAVACALEMQAAIERFNAQRRQAGEDPVEVGIGINSGEVVVGSIGSSRTRQYTCIGDAVNLASRITRMAGPGQVLISEHTLRQLQSKTEYELLPPMTLKGIDGHVDVYLVKEMLGDTWQSRTHS
ncbi:MAG: adenylate/guanylate cyclase domain-containing protein [Mariprofundaceae bacterium]